MLDKIKKHLNIIIIIIRHWWIVVPLISIIFYTVVISCEKNVLAFFKDIWLAENAFWKIADISYVLYVHFDYVGIASNITTMHLPNNKICWL